jgi:methylated-DNA-[protein]-cysteine S-methyltransferase
MRIKSGTANSLFRSLFKTLSCDGDKDDVRKGGKSIQGRGEAAMKKAFYSFVIVDTEFGEAGIVRRQERGRCPVCRIMLPTRKCKAAKRVEMEFPGAVFTPDVCGKMCRDILDFLDGREVVFDFADIDAAIVTGFAKRVLTRIVEIPRGYVMTYGGLAESLGVPGGARAVGNALAGNPFPLFFPCHRVIRADGTLGGFGGGVKLKRQLLEKEGVSSDQRGKVLPNHILTEKGNE